MNKLNYRLGKIIYKLIYAEITLIENELLEVINHKNLHARDGNIFLKILHY